MRRNEINMNPRARNVLVGAFVLASLLILLTGVYFLKETVPGRKTDLYFARFDQVSNLQVGDPVKANGVSVGKITAIALEGNKVKVSFQVRHGLELPSNSEVRIQNIGLMGERQLGIKLGNSTTLVALEGTLSGALDAGIAEAMGIAGVVFIEADSLVKALRRVVDSTIGRPEFSVRTNNLLAAAEEVTQRIARLEREVDPKIREGVQTLNGLSREMDGFVRSQEPVVTEALRNGVEASRHARELAARGERIAQGLEEVLAKMNSRDGTLGALLGDTTLHLQLRSTLKSADSLFKQVNQKGLEVNVDLF